VKEKAFTLEDAKDHLKQAGQDEREKLQLIDSLKN
ncbi:MAG: MerR family transcriptional regulator, partial [Bacteroidia bacterium]|nr:MerR family transcriptional regulator [Bacteroidia bacterium]